jgi:hypothetical protein
LVEVGARLAPPVGIERVVRSDSGVAHRLSSSARVLSAGDAQVKAKWRRPKRFWRLRNRRYTGVGAALEIRPCDWLGRS